MTSEGGGDKGGRREEERGRVQLKGEGTRKGKGKGMDGWDKKWYEGRSKGGRMDEGGESGD